MPSATYRSLLRTPGAAAFFLAGVFGRAGLAMTGIGLVWLVHARTGSYADAGLVTGCFAVADALGGPLVARLVDRFGQVRALPGMLLAHAGSVALLLAEPGGGPLTLVAATLVGTTQPQLSALSGARWAALLRGTPDESALPRAFALEALANSVSFLVGPALVSTVGAAGHPELGTLLAAGLVVGGGTVFALQRRTAPPVAGHAERRHAGRALLRADFVRLVGITLALGVYFGAMQVSIAAYAVERDAAGTAPVLYALSNCTSLVGGWVYGARRWGASPERQRAFVAAGLVLVCLPLTVLDAPAAVGTALALTGFAVPPLLVLSSVLTEAAVPRAVLTQAFTWLNSSSAAGVAGAAAIAGRAVDAAGAHAGFAVAAAAALAMAGLSVAGRRRGKAAARVVREGSDAA